MLKFLLTSIFAERKSLICCTSLVFQNLVKMLTNWVGVMCQALSQDPISKDYSCCIINIRWYPRPSDKTTPNKLFFQIAIISSSVKWKNLMMSDHLTLPSSFFVRQVKPKDIFYWSIYLIDAFCRRNHAYIWSLIIYIFETSKID